MKVVLFCGGLGTRLRDHTREVVPKPLSNIGHRPIIWHLMKYYAHHGHKDFILCLGYRGDLIKEYFLDYKETLSNDFVLTAGGNNIKLLGSDIDDWKIAFIDTGMNNNVGQRLKAVQPWLEDEEYFLANYTDGLSNLDINEQIQKIKEHDAIASFVRVRPSQSFHTVTADESGLVQKIEHVGGADYWINGGFFILNKRIFDYMEDGDELVEAPFGRLIKEKKLLSYKYEGFWAAMDTMKDKKLFDDLHDSGETPWMIWKK